MKIGNAEIELYRIKEGSLASTASDGNNGVFKHLFYITEAQFQGTVTHLATLFGWKWYHTHDSRRSQYGFPDFVMVRGAREIAAELKREKGQPTPEQAEWLEMLEKVPGVEAYLWRPSDLDEIERILR